MFTDGCVTTPHQARKGLYHPATPWLASGPWEVPVRSPSRRVVLLGGLGVAAAACVGGYELIQDGTLPGKYTLARLDGACGSAPPPPVGPPPVRRVATFQSAYRHQAVQTVTLIPAGVSSLRGLGVVVALHGAFASAATMASLMAPAMTAAGVKTFVTICVDGGNTYWHKRADGDDPVGMILHEVLPRAAAVGLRTARIGLTGLSMGGYGALLLAEQLAAARTTAARSARRAATPRITAVAALSPAIFASYADARAADRTSFDSAADFARNDVFTGLQALTWVPTWIACGGDDPFQQETSAVLSRLAALKGHQIEGGIMGGCHDDAFWGRNMPTALRFIAAGL